MNRLRGRVAIITGGAGGIGAATVKRFVAEGAHVAVADIDEARARALADEVGPNAFPVFFDAGEEKSIVDAIGKTVEKFARLDILFNNAAFTSPRIDLDTTVTHIPLDIWDETVSVNQRGVMLGCRHAIPICWRRAADRSSTPRRMPA